MGCVSILGGVAAAVGQGSLMLSEVGPFGGELDATGRDCDWLELRNAGAEAVDLAGMHLSDNPDNWAAWTFPEDVILGAGEHLLLLASGREAPRVEHWNLAVHEDQMWSHTTVSPPESWRRPDFDVSTWPVAPGGFGYGDGDDNTELPEGTMSLYMRRDFYVENPGEVVMAMLSVDADDCFVAFINGREWARSDNLEGQSLVGGSVTPLLYSEAELYAGGMPPVHHLDLGPWLQPGWNTFAVEVHNDNVNSSDFSARPFLALGMSTPAPAETVPLPAWLTPPEEPLHLNFKLSAGEPVIWSDSAGGLVDVLSLTPGMTHEMALGRAASQPSEVCLYLEATPGLPNDAPCFAGMAGVPAMDPVSGWFPEGTTLDPTLAASLPPETEVRFTTDGSDPQPDDPLLSTLPPIAETTALHFRAFAENHLPGPVVQRTYIIREDAPMVPLASITTDPDHLWDWETGIYVLGPNASNDYPFLGANFWQPWSRFSHLEWMDADAVPLATADLDLEIHGGWSRGEPQKSFRIDFKNRYTGDLNVEIFDRRPGLQAFGNFNLRNGGQTSWTNKIQDAFLCDLALEHTHAAAAAWQPTELWLNGEYWGLYGAREKTDERWVEDVYGIPEEHVDMANQWETLAGPASSFEIDAARLLEMSPTSAAFASAFAERFDIASFVDYHIFEIHGQNIDWISADWGVKNLKFFRDGRNLGPWRYVLFDLDACFGQWGTGPGHNELEKALNPPFPSIYSDLLEAFLDNPGFRCGFATRYNDLLNSIFEPSAFESKLYAAATQVSNVLFRHIDRWDSPVSHGYWFQRIQDIASHNAQRIQPSRNQLGNAFGWSGAKDITTSWTPTGGGLVTVNGIPGQWPSWTGAYFGECPVQVAALPAEGFGFTGWSSAAYNDEDWFTPDQPFLTASLGSDGDLEASFSPCLAGVTLQIMQTPDGQLQAVAEGLPAPGSFQWWQGSVLVGTGPTFNPPSQGVVYVTLTLGDCTLVSDPWGEEASVSIIESEAEGVQGLQFHVFPNPSRGQFTVAANLNTRGKVEVIQMSSGQRIESHPSVDFPFSVSGQNWSSGIYAIRVVAENGDAQVLQVALVR